MFGTLAKVKKLFVSDALQVVQNWLAELAGTANAKDLAAHMTLISRDVKVFGVPGIELIDYDDWAAQCQHEFENRILKGVSYQSVRIRTATATRILFTSRESVEATDGTLNVQGVEMLIEKEADGQWRLTQQRVLSEQEFDHLQGV